MMKTLLTATTLCLAVLSFSVTGHADIIYSNLGSYDTSLGGPLVIGSTAAAPFSAQNGKQSFSSGGNFAVTSFTVGVDFYPPGDGFSPLFDAYLYSNFQGQSVTGRVIISGPDMEIAEIGQALQAPISPGLVTFSPPSPLNLSAGSLYWVILTPDNPLTFVVWDAGNSLEVDGTLLTPEPATFGLLGLALPIIIALRKKLPSKP